MVQTVHFILTEQPENHKDSQHPATHWSTHSLYKVPVMNQSFLAPFLPACHQCCAKQLTLSEM